MCLSFDGDRHYFGEKSTAAVEISVENDQFFPAMLLGGSIGAAESYINGHWETNDLVGLFKVFIANQDALNGVDGSLMSSLQDGLGRLWHKARKNNIAGSKENITAHYDLSNEFYKSWLDESMSYSCALFESDAQSLYDAQVLKVRRMISELGLKPGSHILEIGTGWKAYCTSPVRCCSW